MCTKKIKIFIIPLKIHFKFIFQEIFEKNSLNFLN